MARAPWASDDLYVAARRWVDECLRKDGSLFSPGSEIWSKGVLAEVTPRLAIDDVSKRDFVTKLRDQLDGCSDAAIQFTAELLYVHCLPISNMKRPAKLHVIESTLGWMSSPVSIPDDLVRALDSHVANYGAGIAQRDRYVKFFVKFIALWKGLDAAEQDRLLGDAWAFREYLNLQPGPSLMQSEAILHLVDPDTFEYALAPSDKAGIEKAFSGLESVRDASNVDRALAAVRQTVEEALGYELNLYKPWFRSIWAKPAKGAWPNALFWSERLSRAPELDKEERDYKLLIAEHMHEARSALEHGDAGWLEKLKVAFGSPNNITHWQFEHGPFLRWCEANPDRCEVFLRKLWIIDESIAKSIDEALALLPPEAMRTPGARLTLSSLLLSAVDITSYPPYRTTVASKFRRLVGADSDDLLFELEDRAYTPNELGDLLGADPRRVRDFLRTDYPRESEKKGDSWDLTPEQVLATLKHFSPSSPDESGLGNTYELYLAQLDELRVRLLARGVELRDRLDAQSLVWWLVNANPPGSWNDADKEAFERFRGDSQRPKPPNGEEVVTVPDKAWLVRGANVNGTNLVPEWIEQGYISIGWHEVGDLDPALNALEIWEKVKEAYPDDALGASRASAGNLNRFLNMMQPGHLVLTADGDELFVGRITSDASFDSARPTNSLRRRLTCPQ
jgi:hypothetical protein